MATSWNKTAPERFPTKRVESILEVTEADVAYMMPDGDWLVIEAENYGSGTEYCVSFGPTGSSGYNFYTTGNKVRTWRTVKGAARFVKKEGIKWESSRWRQWIPVEEIQKAEAARKAKYQAFQDRVIAAEQQLAKKAQLQTARMEKIISAMIDAGIVDASTVGGDATWMKTFQFDGCEYSIRCEGA